MSSIIVLICLVLATLGLSTKKMIIRRALLILSALIVSYYMSLIN